MRALLYWTTFDRSTVNDELCPGLAQSGLGRSHGWIAHGKAVFCWRWVRTPTAQPEGPDPLWRLPGAQGMD